MSAASHPPRVDGIRAWLITTVCGSRYLLAHGEEGDWWMGAANVPNPNSCRIPSGLWAIEPPHPWPAVVGAPLVLDALHSLDMDDPARVPGGGKVTSAVRAVIQLDLGEHLSAEWSGHLDVDHDTAHDGADCGSAPLDADDSCANGRRPNSGDDGGGS